MKTTYLLSATLLGMLALVSCKKEVNPIQEQVGEPGVLTVTLAGYEPASQASRNPANYVAGAPVVATENAVHQGVIFVFRGTGVNAALDGKATFDFTSTAVSAVNVNITKGIRQVYAVANITPADFANVNNLTDLYNVTNKLSLTTFRSGGALPMSGFLKDVDLTSAATTTVPLNFLGSRIHVNWDISALNAGLAGNVTITGAAILNAKTSSDYFATPIDASSFYSLTHNMTSYAQGYNANISAFSGSYLPTGAGVTNGYDAVLNVAPADNGLAANYTYILENNSSFPTIVAIYGTYNSTTYFWPIVINGALNGVGGVGAGNGTASVARGNIYNVTATIKGLGYTDPYTPISTGIVAVSITTATWNPIIVINQAFN